MLIVGIGNVLRFPGQTFYPTRPLAKYLFSLKEKYTKHIFMKLELCILNYTEFSSNFNTRLA